MFALTVAIYWYHLGLGENRIPLNTRSYHHFPYQNSVFSKMPHFQTHPNIIFIELDDGKIGTGKPYI
jgi:hypothetical protein